MEEKYLEKTELLNYDAENIKTLINGRGWTLLCTYDKIKAVYEYVQNEILFGYNRSDLLTAEEVLTDGYGQCNTKATLLMALLRGVGIPCRLHGFEVNKQFQRGVTTGLISLLAPETIVHTWAEVYYENRWVALEGVITDLNYVEAVKKKYRDHSGSFLLYAIATPDLRSLNVEWNGSDTYVQKEAVVKDYGTFDSPDAFFAQHTQKWSGLKDFAYVHIGRKIMMRNVEKMRKVLFRQ